MYARHAKEDSKKNIIVILILLIVLLVNIAIVQAADSTDKNIVDPSPNQYFELRATQIKEVTRSK